jgi:hypothetical protein
MRVYRVSRFRDGGESDGFDFYTSRRDAERAVREHAAETEDMRLAGVGEAIDTFEAPLTKAGLLRFLNHWANHPNNG